MSLEEFEEWCRSQGCQFPRVSLGEIEGFGGGVICRSDIPDGFDAVVVPLDLLINVETVKRSELWGTLSSFNLNLSDYEWIYVFLLWEKYKKSGSRWAPYIEILPKELPVPLLTDDDELKCIRHTNMMSDIIKIRQAMARLTEKMEVVKAARPDMFPVGFDFEDLTWAYAIFASRALSVLWTDQKTCLGSLVPLADMMNHSGAAHVEYLTHVGVEKTDVFSIRMKKGVKAGQQVFLNYGVRTEEKMLMNYGFVEEGTPFFMQSLLLRAGLSEDDPFYDRKIKFMNDRNLTFDMYITEDPLGLDASLQLCRLLTASEEDEFRALERDLSFPLLGNEADALDALEGQFEATLKRLESVPAPPNPPKSEIHQRLISYAASQRRIAAFALQKIQSRIESEIPPRFAFDDDDEEDEMMDE